MYREMSDYMCQSNHVGISAT